MKINFLFICLFAYLLITPKSLAQAPQSGITVNPSIIHLDLSQDPPEYQIKYTNTTNANITLSLSVQDFTELEDGYKLTFLQGKDASNYKYSLSSWVTFDNRTVELNPGETKTVRVFIDSTRITKGGHYASVLAEIVQPQGSQQIGVKAILSSLLFVRASTGQEMEDGKIVSFDPNRDGIDYPDAYILRFENSGNTVMVPYGLIQVFDPFGKMITKGIVDEASSDTLPESIRRFDTQVETSSKLLIPGFYTAKINLHFGKTNQKAFSSVRFFSQGSFDFIKIGIVLFVLIILGAYLKKHRKNNKSAKSL